MVIVNSIIVLDDDDEDEVVVQLGFFYLFFSIVLLEVEVFSFFEFYGVRGSSSLGGKKCYKLENEKLF